MEELYRQAWIRDMDGILRLAFLSEIISDSGYVRRVWRTADGKYLCEESF